MASFSYPTKSDFEFFVGLLTEENYPIAKYLPPVNKNRYQSVDECVRYVEETAYYDPCTIYEECARLLYKITKKHELADANKRSAVIAVYLFCVLNDYVISDPEELKRQAKRIASTRGRVNENLLRKRVASNLQDIVERAQLAE